MEMFVGHIRVLVVGVQIQARTCQDSKQANQIREFNSKLKRALYISVPLLFEDLVSCEVIRPPLGSRRLIELGFP